MLSRGQITSTIPLCTPVCGVAITYLAEDTVIPKHHSCRTLAFPYTSTLQQAFSTAQGRS